MNVRRAASPAILAASLLLASAARGENAKFEKTYPFGPDRDVKIGFKAGPVTIESFRVRHWPDTGDMAKGERDLNDTHTVWVEFTYSNRDEQHNYKCLYTVAVPGGPNGIHGKNDRTATLDKGKIGDTNKVSFRMKTHLYKSSKNVRITLYVWKD
jgi:hypothetical protein